MGTTAPGTTWMERSVVLLLCLGVSISLVYFPVTKYDLLDPATGGREGDVAQYTRMSQGAPLTSIPKPYRYRVLTPWLASMVPFLPPAVTQFYDIDASKTLKFKFGVVNLVGMTLAAWTLHLLCRRLGYSARESLLGSLLFLTSFHVVNYAGLPLVDAWGYFFLVLSVLAMVQDRLWLLCAAMLVGMIEKETTALVVLYALLMPRPWKYRARALMACLPGLVAYAIFRFALYPTDLGYNYSLAAALGGVLHAFIPNKLWIYIAFDGGMAFGFVWILALLGWWIHRSEPDHVVARLAPVVPLILLVPFAIGSNIGRIWFLAFPIVIPLALDGLRRLVPAVAQC
jgi:hypothetical protein